MIITRVVCDPKRARFCRLPQARLVGRKPKKIATRLSLPLLVSCKLRPCLFQGSFQVINELDSPGNFYSSQIVYTSDCVYDLLILIASFWGSTITTVNNVQGRRKCWSRPETLHSFEWFPSGRSFQHFYKAAVSIKKSSVDHLSAPACSSVQRTRYLKIWPTVLWLTIRSMKYSSSPSTSTGPVPPMSETEIHSHHSVGKTLFKVDNPKKQIFNV
jgi:hypothetical protein